MSHNAKLKQLPKPHKAPRNLWLESVLCRVKTWLFLCRRSVWKLLTSISCPLKNVRNIDPPIPIIVPTTLAFPAVLLIFNFSMLPKLKK